MYKRILQGLAIILLPITSIAQVKPTVSVAIGYSYLTLGEDFSSAKRFFEEDAREYDYTFDCSDPRNGFTFMGELKAIFTPQIMAGVGVGYLMEMGSAKITDKDDPGDYLEGSATISAIPISATGYLTFPISKLSSFYVGGGIVHYLARISGKGSETDNYIKEPEHSFSVSSGGTGFSVLGGIEFSIAPNMALNIGLRGNICKISGFRGTVEMDKGDVNAVLIYDEDYGLQIDEDEPEERYGERLAVVDFSGVNLLVGLRFSF